MGVYSDKVRQHFLFGRRETSSILLSLLVITMAFAFNDNNPTFVASAWLANFVAVAFIAVISFLVHQAAQKFVALFAGYRAEYRAWGWGIMFCLIITFASRGQWVFIPLGGVFIHHLAIQRIGMFRYGLSLYYSTLIAVSGPLANVVLALIFKLLFLGTNNPYLLLGMKMNLWMAFYSILPFPPLDGGTGFFGGRSTYAFWFGFIIIAILLIMLLSNVFWIVAGAIVLSLVFWLLYYLFIEAKAW